LEHEIEGAWRSFFAMAFRNHFARFLRARNFVGLIGPKTAFAGFTVNHRIAERVHMAAGLPDFRVHDDGGFEADDIVAQLDHVAPPQLLDVALEFGTERTVIPKTVDAAVNFRGLINEPAPLAQRHDFFHQGIFFCFSHWAGQVFAMNARV